VTLTKREEKAFQILDEVLRTQLKGKVKAYINGPWLDKKIEGISDD
jgi:hypothetical protein